MKKDIFTEVSDKFVLAGSPRPVIEEVVATPDEIKKENLITLFRKYSEIVRINPDWFRDKEGSFTQISLMELCTQAEIRYDEFFKLDGDNSKVNRWLGYLQGILIYKGLLNVEDERNETRRYLTAHQLKEPSKGHTRKSVKDILVYVYSNWLPTIVEHLSKEIGYAGKKVAVDNPEGRLLKLSEELLKSENNRHYRWSDDTRDVSLAVLFSREATLKKELELVEELILEGERV